MTRRAERSPVDNRPPVVPSLLIIASLLVSSLLLAAALAAAVGVLVRAVDWMIPR